VDDATVPRALSIAGSDSGGGAGIQADLNTFGAFGVFGTTAITAVTVQNTSGVSGFQEIAPRTVAAQIRAVAEDIGVDAAKTGMLASAPIVNAVADAVAAMEISPLVVDPVFVSKHGHRLLAQDAVASLRERILPLATLVTPNLPEAAELAAVDVAAREDMRKVGERLLELGSSAVLVKGGHLDRGGADDLFMDGKREEWLESERLQTRHTHGTGCVLSAAIAAELARGAELLDAVRSGKTFVTEAIRHGLSIGSGIGPVDPLWRSRR
jgi:hydroxymethylpyrimidine/phosphomethylpyrimidine kinase